ncbi:hypothetical protein K491DRAFT_733954 [Lophiostoma macrostomum CBS 122681]|uniref:EKC/KEOPS complex subunit BUD32 n=1 Tax=Lophiostoma macrostomum CBS 122681 TaxID=1314788 RepID=A0A6A6TRZ8_9PLEO|nr:hypothetical protein K491DRAFT_733954 [Lophiostoma macrostomum CBS 122681]
MADDSLDSFPTSARDKFKPLQFLDEGFHGEVHLCTLNSPEDQTTVDSLVCIKRISNPTMPGANCSNLQSLQRAQESTLCPRTFAKVSDIAVVQQAETYPRWYAMEYIRGRTLHDLHKICPKFPDFLVFHIFIEIHGALKFLRALDSKQLYHNDLSTANIMLSHDNNSNDLPRVTLVDYESLRSYSGATDVNKAERNIVCLPLLETLQAVAGEKPRLQNPILNRDENEKVEQFYSLFPDVGTEDVTLERLWDEYGKLAEKVLLQKAWKDMPTELQTELEKARNDKDHLLSRDGDPTDAYALRKVFTSNVRSHHIKREEYAQYLPIAKSHQNIVPALTTPVEPLPRGSFPYIVPLSALVSSHTYRTMPYSIPMPSSAQAHYTQLAPGPSGSNGQILLCTPRPPQDPQGSPPPTTTVALKCYYPGVLCQMPPLTLLESLKHTQTPSTSNPCTHLPQILDLRCYPEWYTMQYIPGLSLESLSAHYAAFPDFLIAHIFVEIFSAVHDLRDRPEGALRHTDIHAGNVMLECVRGGEGEDAWEEVQVPGLPNVKLVDLDALEVVYAGPAYDGGEESTYRTYAESCFQTALLLNEIMRARPEDVGFEVTGGMGEEDVGALRAFEEYLRSDGGALLEGVWERFGGVAEMVRRGRTVGDLPEGLRNALYK